VLILAMLLGVATRDVTITTQLRSEMLSATLLLSLSVWASVREFYQHSISAFMSITFFLSVNELIFC